MNWIDFWKAEAYGLQMGMGIMPTQRRSKFSRICWHVRTAGKAPKEVPGVKKVTD